MYREQRSLCIYCEKQITEVYPPPRIDHWQSNQPQTRARPPLEEPIPVLYDRQTPATPAKGEPQPFRWDDPSIAHMPWPVDRPYENVVRFTSLGEIYVRADVVLSDATRRALELAIADRPDGAQMQAQHRRT